MKCWELSVDRNRNKIRKLNFTETWVKAKRNPGRSEILVTSVVRSPGHILENGEYKREIRWITIFFCPPHTLLPYGNKILKHSNIKRIQKFNKKILNIKIVFYQHISRRDNWNNSFYFQQGWGRAPLNPSFNINFKYTKVKRSKNALPRKV